MTALGQLPEASERQSRGRYPTVSNARPFGRALLADIPLERTFAFHGTGQGGKTNGNVFTTYLLRAN
jgi:hypothetical protein